MPKTTIVLPTYNERTNLPNMVAALLALEIENLAILVVDDNSPDGTGVIADELAAQHPAQVSVIHRPGKGGLGKAYVAAFEHLLAQGNTDYIMQMDTDFSHQSKYVPQMIAEIEKGYDFVIGSRYTLGGSVDPSWSIFRKLLSGFANRVYINTLLHMPIKDATGGFRIWRRETIIGMDTDRIHSNGYIFQAETAYVAHKLGYTSSEIPIHFPDRHADKSKMGLSIQIEAALRVFQVIFNHRHLTPAMRHEEKVPQPSPGSS